MGLSEALIDIGLVRQALGSGTLADFIEYIEVNEHGNPEFGLLGIERVCVEQIDFPMDVKRSKPLIQRMVNRGRLEYGGRLVGTPGLEASKSEGSGRRAGCETERLAKSWSECVEFT